MPWHTSKGGGTCAAGEWAVLKDSDGSTAGCHPTEAAAKKQLAALYAKEPQMNNHGPRGGEYRSFRFDLERADADGDGLTFEGYAAVFNQPDPHQGLGGRVRRGGQAGRVRPHPRAADPQTHVRARPALPWSGRCRSG